MENAPAHGKGHDVWASCPDRPPGKPKLSGPWARAKKKFPLPKDGKTTTEKLWKCCLQENLKGKLQPKIGKENFPAEKMQG